MRKFTVECSACGTSLDVTISEADLLDPDPHTVVCVECGIESDFEFDAETQDLIPVEDDDDEEEDEPAETDAAEEGEDDGG